MTAQKAGIPGSGGGVPPAKGMEYCFRVVSKISKSSKAETNQPKVDVYCTELHSDRVQWVESTRKQMELKQIASLDGARESEPVEIKMSLTKMFPPAPKSICGESNGSPCLTSLPVNIAPANATEDFKSKPALAVMEGARYSRTAPIKAAYDQKWEVERVSVADILAEKDEEGKPIDGKDKKGKEENALDAVEEDHSKATPPWRSAHMQRTSQRREKALLDIRACSTKTRSCSQTT